MKNLQEYIKESLSLDIKLNETSLLDDFDNLINKADLVVNRKGTIGEKYEVRQIEDWGLLKNIDKSKLKKYPCFWDYDGSKVRVEYVNLKTVSRFDSPDAIQVDMINALLSFNFKDLELGEYRSNSKLLSFFNSLFEINSMEGRIIKERGQTIIELGMKFDDKELYIWLLKK